MPIPVTDADGILPDLRHAAVDDVPGRAFHARAAALPRPPARASAGRRRAGRADATARRASGLPVTLGLLGGLVALLAGCARDADPQVFAVPAAAAARIRTVCPPGTFVGTMAANCPQPLQASPRAAPDQ